MPRHARMKVPGFPLHVLQRGHNKRPCFEQHNDYKLYLRLLDESRELHPCRIHAFVLMTNHVHLLVTPHEPEHLSRMMKRINEQYAMHFNKAYSRTGSIWEGRFKMCIVDSAAYLLSCQRYIELNPVRAGMVRHPADYEWSSFRANGYGEATDLLSPHDVYRDMGATDNERRLAYRRFVRVPPSDNELGAIRSATSANVPLGSNAFLSALPAECRRIARGRGRPKKS